MRNHNLQQAISNLAALFDFGALKASTAPAEFMDDARKEILFLRAELAALYKRAEQAEGELHEIASVLPGVAYMDPPDGGSPSIPEQFRRMRADLDRTAAEVEQMRADAERYRKWRHEFREGSCGLWNALCEANSDAEHDAAIDAAIDAARAGGEG